MWGWNRFVPVAIVSIASSLLSIAPVIALEPQEIAAQATKFVVKIDGAGSGTGFIVRKNGNRYTVLTNEHVIRSAANYTITTADDRRHTINSNQIRKFSGVDLAEIEFTSTNNYSIAELSNNSTNSFGGKVYAAGWTGTSNSFKIRTLLFLPGMITGNLQESRSGYSLSSTLNQIPGLSGSPLLDENGKVIGVYGSADVQKKEGTVFVTLALGIPISTYQKSIESGRIETAPSIVSDPDSSRKAEEYFEIAKKKQLGGDNQGALVDYNRAIAIKSDYARAYVNRGLVKYKLNDNNGAMQDYNRAISLKSNYIKIDYLYIVYLNRGVLKGDKLNDINGALADYNQAIALKPNYATAYDNRGVLKEDKLNDINGALADYNQAIALKPDYATAYNNRARLKKYKLNDINGAMQDFRQAQRLYKQQGNDSGYNETVEELRKFG
jgi:S1-C subfamily serine protease